MHNEWADSASASNTLLCSDDPPVTIVTNRGGRAPILLIGDHAGRAIPRRLGDLGLPPAAFDLHIAWDIGIAGLGERLAAACGATFIAQSYSRLVIDCNRRLGEIGSIPPVSDQIAIPSNRSLSETEIAARQAEIYQPYQDAIAAGLDRRASDAKPTLLVALHSFTPVFQGHARPWRFGVLHRGDSEASRRMLALMRDALSDEIGDIVGDNQPYAMDGTDNTVPLHADPRGLDYLELEVRQDLIADPKGQADVAAWLAPLIMAAAAN